MSQAARASLCLELTFQRESQRADLMDPARTSTGVVAMLLHTVQEIPLLITAAYSDHCPDGCYGPHGHHPDKGPGYAEDLWPEHEDQGPLLIHNFVYQNPFCTKVGLGGKAKTWWTKGYGDFNGTIVFEDNDSDHIHVQSDE